MPAFRRAVLLALIPAVALAAPKKKKPPKETPKPADSGKGSDSSADAPPDKDAAVGGGGGGGGSASGNGGGAGSDATPAPAEPPKDTAADKDKDKDKDKPSGNEPDVDALRQEYLALRDELFKSRARANAVASALYSTRVQIRFSWASTRYYGVSKASIRLDGANVFEDTSGAIGGDDGVRFDGYVAPGKHLVTFHVEASGKDDDSFTSSTEAQIVIKAVAGKDLLVAAKAKDGGDIAYEWKRKEKGSYGLGIDVGVKTVARAPDAGGTPAPAKKGK